MVEQNQEVIIQSDYYNALYVNGRCKEQAKPDYLDAETMARLMPNAEVYWVPQDVYDMALDGEGYPDNLADFPLSDCRKLR